jgi:hypothetical protein
MALLPILCYPDPKLHTVAKPVAVVDARIKTLIFDMLDTMHEAKGIGLAATQVNVHERVIVIDVSEGRDAPLVLINPEIIWASSATAGADPARPPRRPRHEAAGLAGQATGAGSTASPWPAAQPAPGRQVPDDAAARRPRCKRPRPT